MAKSLRVLIVDDSEDDALLLLRHLKREGFDPHHQHVATAEDLRAAIRMFNWDLILCDYNMPGFDPQSALDALKASGRTPGDALETLAKEYPFLSRATLNRVVYPRKA